MKGKISAFVLKVMAVVSALAIGGGYVAWRQVEAKKAMAEQAEAQEKRAREKLLHEMDEAWQESVNEQELLPGSKNPGRSITRGEIDGILEKRGDFIHPIPGIPAGSEEVSNVTPMLPGSKSISMPLFTKDDITNEGGLLPPIEELDEEEATQPDTKQKHPTLLPGSKSGIFIPEEPEPEKSE